MLHWIATRGSWGLDIDRCSQMIALNDPRENYPYCVNLEKLSISIDPSAATVHVTANGYPIVNTENIAFQCLVFHNTTKRLTAMNGFSDNKQLASWLEQYLHDSDVLVFVSFGAVADDATKAILATEYQASRTKYLNAQNSYVLVAEKRGRIMVEEKVSRDDTLNVQTSVQCDGSVMFTTGCFTVDVFSGGYYDGKGA